MKREALNRRITVLERQRRPAGGPEPVRLIIRYDDVGEMSGPPPADDEHFFCYMPGGGRVPPEYCEACPDRDAGECWESQERLKARRGGDEGIKTAR